MTTTFTEETPGGTTQFMLPMVVNEVEPEGGGVHTPEVHKKPVAHVFAHAPQLCVSVVVLTHVAPHAVCPAAVHAHAPARHACPPGHTVPHAPQLCESVAVLVQVPPQTT